MSWNSIRMLPHHPLIFDSTLVVQKYLIVFRIILKFYIAIHRNSLGKRKVVAFLFLGKKSQGERGE